VIQLSCLALSFVVLSLVLSCLVWLCLKLYCLVLSRLTLYEKSLTLVGLCLSLWPLSLCLPLVSGFGFSLPWSVRVRVRVRVNIPFLSIISRASPTLLIWYSFRSIVLNDACYIYYTHIYNTLGLGLRSTSVCVCMCKDMSKIKKNFSAMYAFYQCDPTTQHSTP
jgi:hypothetical protein